MRQVDPRGGPDQGSGPDTLREQKTTPGGSDSGEAQQGHSWRPGAAAAKAREYPRGRLKHDREWARTGLEWSRDPSLSEKGQGGVLDTLQLRDCFTDFADFVYDMNSIFLALIFVTYFYWRFSDVMHCGGLKILQHFRTHFCLSQ